VEYIMKAIVIHNKEGKERKSRGVTVETIC
jgi:hypothetical protein